MDAQHKSLPSQSGGKDDRALRLEELREALVAAKIPVSSKRGSLIGELPQNATDCQMLPGTTRCALPLCEDSCAQRHQHHRTHAKPLAADAPLVYSRPSIIGAQRASSLGASPFESPAVSVAPSTTTSPQQQYRRASAFGFNLPGSHTGTLRGSIILSGLTTPAEAVSGPPSPLSDSSALSSAANSPRERTGVSAVPLSFNAEPIQSIAEEESKVEAPAAALAALKEEPVQQQAAVAAAAPESSGGILAPHLAALDSVYWKLRNHIINLADYRPGPSGVATDASRARMDLAAAPRDDFPDQEHCAFDPRSPQPPSPVEMDGAQVLEANINENDPTRPEVEYVIRQ